MDIEYLYPNYTGPTDYKDAVSIAHGRIEVKRIWTTTELNDKVIFPHVAQVYKIERETTNKKSGETSHEIAYGVMSRSTLDASP